MDRQQLLDALSTAMQGHAEDRGMLSKLRAGQVKSRLLEAHPAEASEDGTGHLLEKLAVESDLRVERLDADLWALVGSDDLYFIDALNPRFWLLHSTARAVAIEKLLRRHFLPDPKMDSAWLGSEQLREIEGAHRWVKSSFASDLLEPEDESGEVPRRLKVQVEIESADDFIDLLGNNPAYKAGAVLTAIGTVLREEGFGSAKVIADYKGAFISQGGSFHLVAGMLWRTLDRYEEYVLGLERAFQLGTHATEEMGIDITGEVATIALPRAVDDLDSLVANLFTSREPFRLWGVPRQVSDRQWEANAVDLHVGHPLRMEISPEWIRVLLGPHTCGNTLARLVANLQHRFDARIQVPSVSVAA
jgi:hypothetical protein